MKEDLSEMSSSQADENDEGTRTVIENKAKVDLEEEDEEKNSVEDSLQKVESILMEIDKELGNNGDENVGLKESLSSLSEDPKDDSNKKTHRYLDLAELMMS